MKLPNRYGSITKLSGKRRNPWRVRKFVKYEYDKEKDRQKNIYKNIGYYPTKSKALEALAQYNANPLDIDEKITFAELYEKFSKEKFETISKSSISSYKTSYKHCTDALKEMPFTTIRRIHLQNEIDTCGKNYPVLFNIKKLFLQMYQYAQKNDICEKNYAEFVDILKYKPKEQKAIHKIFTKDEIDVLWENISDDYVTILLMLIYSGVRISELLDLKKENINLEEQYFDVVKSKTSSGVRKVPIADKTLMFFKHWYNGSTSEYLITSSYGNHLSYHNYVPTYWMPIMDKYNMQHLPHDTRHTCVSLLAEKNINQTIIKKIVGHKGAMNLTEKVYTHFDIKPLLTAINSI